MHVPERPRYVGLLSLVGSVLLLQDHIRSAAIIRTCVQGSERVHGPLFISCSTALKSPTAGTCHYTTRVSQLAFSVACIQHTPYHSNQINSWRGYKAMLCVHSPWRVVLLFRFWSSRNQAPFVPFGHHKNTKTKR
jgi:hypothetical protein